MLVRLGREAEARDEFERAAAMTGNARQRSLFAARAAALAPAAPGSPGPDGPGPGAPGPGAPGR